MKCQGEESYTVAGVRWTAKAVVITLGIRSRITALTLSASAPKINPDVAPNSYNLIHDFLRSDKPRYSIGKRSKEHFGKWGTLHQSLWPSFCLDCSLFHSPRTMDAYAGDRRDSCPPSSIGAVGKKHPFYRAPYITLLFCDGAIFNLVDSLVQCYFSWGQTPRLPPCHGITVKTIN